MILFQVLKNLKIPFTSFILFAGLCLVSPAHGQNGINFVSGLVLAGDVNLNSVSDTASHRKGFHVGVDARIGPYGFFLNPGLHYYNIEIVPNTGFNFLSDGPRYHIIKGPLNIAYKMFITRKFKFRIKGGLDINYVLLIDENDYGISFENVNDAYFGLNLGAGFDISRFTIDVNYESGLTNSLTDDDNSRINYFSASLGFFF
jgi:hypothetical protein